ncbi:MAG: 2-oxoacid:ferredoxin oxidoreductase subunit gamma [Deltaproteobacteria bacterium CG03_land_8_20_14_0_80_45_14]|nr:MAG: 2-oxoacid:ferredoxin oxidoreductase subunit gamma [Deltaproteobacteria bacterium CG03_land_8_20_14_0_80_45_14]
MLIKTIFSGFGGQGVVMMGYLLAIGGMYEDKNVTCLPSYGAEVRGGTANCTVVLSTEEIASPVASEPEFAVLMNNPSLFRFQNQVQSGGTIFLNSSMIESRPIRGDLEIYEIPVNDLAKQLHSNKVSNMIMLGAFIKKAGLVSLETINHALKDTFGNRNPTILKSNKTALLLGYNYLE